MSKVSAVAKFTIKADKADEFPGAFDEFFAHIKDNEPGTEHYVLHRSTANPNIFYITEVYADQAGLDAHATSEAMQKFGAGLGDFIENVDLDFTTVVKAAKGA
jgi:(4S)-4-hydroxy-5-phosphonooxypentane-2,3-dione isomerase